MALFNAEIIRVLASVWLYSSLVLPASLISKVELKLPVPVLSITTLFISSIFPQVVVKNTLNVVVAGNLSTGTDTPPTLS